MGRVKAGAGGFHGDVGFAQDGASGKIVRRHEALAHFPNGLGLLGQNALDAVSQRLPRATKITKHLMKTDGFERERIVGALPGAVQSKMLLENPGSEHIGDGRHGDAVVVVGKADNDLGEIRHGAL